VALRSIWLALAACATVGIKVVKPIVIIAIAAPIVFAKSILIALLLYDAKRNDGIME
jgi:hypothetical protein